MPTVQCPRCSKVVRFEGVAGVCPGCGSVVRSAKPVAAAAAAAPPRSSSKPASGRPGRTQADINDLAQVAGGDEEQFNPGVTPYSGPSGPGLDKRLIYGIGGAVGLVFLVGIFVVLYNPKPPPQKVINGPPPTQAPAGPAPAANTPTVAQPPVESIVTPTTSPGEIAAKPPWWNLKPVKPDLPPPLITDRMVEESLKKGVGYLKGQFVGKQLKSSGGDDKFPGEDAICVYALLHAGHALDDSDLSTSGDFMKGLLDKLDTMEFGPSFAVYGHSLRLQALSLAERETDSRYRAADLSYLLKADVDGTFAYAVPELDENKKPKPINMDHSNSQYGVLGVWAAADAQLDVPGKFWSDVENHWITAQNKDGGWGYHNGDQTSLTMTCAGVTSLSVAAEQQAVIISKGKHDNHLQMSEGINKALDWLGDGNHLIYFDNHPGYTLYGVERAALATGYRFFGTHDWFRELGATQISQQDKDGSWPGIDGTPVETAFRLLFLARGRQPLLLDKLRFDGNWNNRPRDAAKLTQFVSKSLERTFAWSVADITRDPAEWLESPMLLITTDADPNFSDEDITKLRTYVENGGMILLNNEGGASAAKQKEIDGFDKAIIAKIFPDYPLKPAAADDLVFTANAKFKPAEKPPAMMTVSNGSRVLLVYAPTDLGKGWVNAKLNNKYDIDMRMGLNIFVDAAGKDQYRNRLNTPYIDPSTVKPVGEVPIFRIKYAGHWDPEPGAYTRFERSIQNQTSLKITLLPVESSDLDVKVAPIATLTGNTAADLSKLDVVKIRNYVKEGGTLIIDSAGGNKEFAAAVHDQLMQQAFPSLQTSPLTPDSGVIDGSLPFTEQLKKPRARSSTALKLSDTGADVPPVSYANVGKGQIYISDLDLTTGLLGTNTYGIFGYTPAYCEGFFKDVVLYTLNRNADPVVPKDGKTPAGKTPAEKTPAGPT